MADEDFLGSLLRAALTQARSLMMSSLSNGEHSPSGLGALGLLYVTVGVRMMACAGKRLDDRVWDDDHLQVIASGWLNLWQHFGQACVMCGRVFDVDEQPSVVGRVAMEVGTRTVRSCNRCEQLAKWLVPRWVNPPGEWSDQEAGECDDDS